jgi:hypothetical protein
VLGRELLLYHSKPNVNIKTLQKQPGFLDFKRLLCSSLLSLTWL